MRMRRFTQGRMPVLSFSPGGWARFFREALLNTPLIQNFNLCVLKSL